MDPQLREAALPYFAGGKQWNYGRFLHHLDTTLPQYPKLRDKKLRHEIGQELWKSLLWEQAGNNTDQEKKLKALQELAVSVPFPPPSPIAHTHRVLLGHESHLAMRISPQPTARDRYAQFAHALDPPMGRMRRIESHE